MTTREEFALAFAVSTHTTVLQTLLEAARTGRESPSPEDLEKMNRETITGSVEMADVLIAELEKPVKAPEPPLKT